MSEIFIQLVRISSHPSCQSSKSHVLQRWNHTSVNVHQQHKKHPRHKRRRKKARLLNKHTIMSSSNETIFTLEPLTKQGQLGKYPHRHTFFNVKFCDQKQTNRVCLRTNRNIHNVPLFSKENSATKNKQKSMFFYMQTLWSLHDEVTKTYRVDSTGCKLEHCLKRTDACIHSEQTKSILKKQ